jgi:hypothetical protein
MQGGAQASRRPARARRVKHDAGRRDDISWMSLIRTARVPFAFQALVAAGLLLPAQMRDMLAALAETPAWRPWAAFPASMAVFGFLSWYWARATLSARFDLPDTRHAWDEAVALGRQGERPFVREAPLHIVPQAPIPLAGITGLLLALQSGALGLGVATLISLLALWFLVDRRRRMRDWVRRRFMPGRVFLDVKLPHEMVRLRSTYSLRIWLRRAPFRFYKVLQRAPGGVWPASALLGLSVAVFSVTAAASCFPAVRLDDPRNLIWTIWRGPTPILLGCALMLGPLSAASFVLDGLRMAVWIRGAPAGVRRPPVIFTLLAASVLIPGFIDLHAMRTVPGVLPLRPTLAQHWQAWQAACGPATRPVVVAISGGAARAALWGAAVLAEIDRQAAGQDAAIFAVSTVSGGSLGAAAYLSVRAVSPPGEAGTAAACQLAPGLQARFKTYAEELGAADAIGPLLAGFVLSDVPRSLIGWAPALLGAPMRGGDRAAALERAFEANAARAAHHAGLRPLPLDTPYLSLAGPAMPLWIGIATERDTGGRVLVTQVRGSDRQGTDQDWPFEGAADLLAQLGTDIPASTAVNATGRFPFLEPSGVTPNGLALIDGGYYDQSGMETALELADWLRRQGAAPILVAATGSGYGNGLGVHGLHSPSDDIVRCGADQFRPEQPPTTETAADVLAPLVGLNHARAGHVDAVLRRARGTWCDGPTQGFFHFYLGALGEEPVPLNWVLSRQMADHVWLSAGHGDAGNESEDVFVRTNRREAANLRKAIEESKARGSAPGPRWGRRPQTPISLGQ